MVGYNGKKLKKVSKLNKFITKVFAKKKIGFLSKKNLKN